MAFTKPAINTIQADIKNAYVYLRAVRKWGKTTTWKNLILQKYHGDPSKGLLVELGNEHGTTMLDNINVTHISSYSAMVELKKWLIAEKGKEHNIEMLCFDVVDELPEIFDKEICRLSTLENPNKPCRSIKSAFGGYNAGPEASANKIKAYMEDLKSAGFGIFCIGHTKMKAVSDRASTEDDKWMTLTGNLTSNYEAAIADVCDIVLTGNVEREFETKGEGDNAKNYLVSEERRLYFRGTELVSAGSRFAPGACPDYIVFDGAPEDFAKKLITTIEEGMEKSKTDNIPTSTKKSPKPTPTLDDVSELKDSETVTNVEDDELDTTTDIDLDALRAEIRAMHKNSTKKKEMAAIIKERGGLLTMNADQLLEIKSMY